MSLIQDARTKLHRDLIAQEIFCYCPLSAADQKKYAQPWIASNADSGQKSSCQIGNGLLAMMESKTGLSAIVQKQKPKGQTLGNAFESLCASFLQDTFPYLAHLRPGHWQIAKSASRASGVIGQYEQYSHLAELDRLAEAHAELRNFLGDGYTIAPDVVIARLPETDEQINQSHAIVDPDNARNSMLRSANHADPQSPSALLHASISCKFTMRSDRSQNTRTEALNLIRSRKGRVPHIVAVTAEPMPARIASLAIGTGDIDCVYHVALYELKQCLEQLDRDDLVDSLNSMIEGKRLKDISDLPLDLAI
ncbi:NgoMIV family type II restriction endonuclease [Parathalassolituus penaei]|uniref:Restriction endonuclease n=1 Tax=Parathalassolituus penaei TaxID=2997323 RepID=A0A9X3ISQ6_9GAMM|nr:NgoMIV family type II restriction endonuclease [Parathalassolituus penaei]MCY0966081.1 hypothetical protein [Parathalassolituus penaei]